MEKYEVYKQPLIDLAKRVGIGYNIDNPVTIQDKINWLKIYDSTPLKTKCADKIQLHDYCKEKLGVDLCIPIIKVYDRVDDIDWDELPNQFVVKCNHGSGMNIIVKNKSKLNIPETKRKLEGFMADDFAFHVGYEMHYHDIPHKVFVEEYMTDEKQETSLFDYKFWCFNGEPKFMTVNDGHGHGTMNFYDLNFVKLDIRRTDYRPMVLDPEKPKTFDIMSICAKVLSEDFKFVRVDFYEINEKVYLGELTFTPGAGFFCYNDLKYNKIIGDMLNLK